MSASRLDRGQSDPISYTCTCAASSIGGVVLLYYRYWSNDPKLPNQELGKASDLEKLAAWYREVTEKHNLAGKIRIAQEGYNVTVGGTNPEIDQYIQTCRDHWSFASLHLSTREAQNLFFKPSPGCACVFGPSRAASVRITAEITPMGIHNYSPSSWSSIEALSPADFHRRCHDEDILLLDVRNVYESRIGYFVSPRTGEMAVRPPIRRFSQWPRIVEHCLQGEAAAGRCIVTYCTGGIRCEKATRWMSEKVATRERGRICTLRGGIAAYLAWMDEEVREGRKELSQSLFRGRNYVFDARGSVGLSAGGGEPVSRCHVCEVLSDRLSKCRSKGCHLILVICPVCDEGDVRCCESCREMDTHVATEPIPRLMCECESQREAELWGGQRVKVTKTQGWRKARKKAQAGIEQIDIQIKTLD